MAITARTAWKDILSPVHLEQIFAVLETAHSAAGEESFKEAMVESLTDTFGVRSATFFFGATYAEMFTDTAPPVLGISEAMMERYHEEWFDKDIFALPQAQHMLQRTGFVTLADLPALPPEQREYVHGQLTPHGLGSAAALHLRFADGEAILGLFDHSREWNGADAAAMRMLAKHLQPACRTMSLNGPAAPTDIRALLSPRQCDVAELISAGMTNAEIAGRLCITEATVKKYVSRIFEATGLRNRSMLAAAMLRS